MEIQFTRRPWLLQLVLFGLALALLRPAVLPLTPGAALDGNDFTGNFYPLYGYTAETALSGELPLWNPRQFAGFPVAGNPQAALFYPATWAVWGLAAVGVSVPRALGISVVIHVWLAAWGMAAFSRRLGLRYLAVIAAGVVYAMSGWAGARLYAGHYTILTTYAWLPWVLTGYALALERRTWPALLPATGALGLMALAGHPQMVLYAVLGMLSLAVYRAWAIDEQALTLLWDGVWRLGVIGAGALVLGAALVFPTAQLTAYSVRGATDIAFVNEFALFPAQLLTLALPFLYGNPHVGPSFYWGAVTFEELTAYAGLLPLIALLLLPRLRDRRASLPFGLVVAGLVFSLGVDGVVFGLLARWVPGFSLFRAPGRFLFFVTLGLALAVALLLDHLQTSSQIRREATLSPALRVVPWGIVMLFAGSVFFSGWYASASHVEPMPHRAQAVAGVLAYSGLMLAGVWGVLWLFRDKEQRMFRLGLVCALLLVTVDAWRSVTPILRASDVTTRPLWEAATAGIETGPDARVLSFADPNDYFRNAVNNSSLTGHLNVDGYDPLEINSYHNLLRLTENDPTHPFMDLIGLRYVVTWQPREDEGFALDGLYDGGIVYERENPMPRAWVATDGYLQPNDGAARGLIQDQQIDPRQTVILSAPLDCPLGDDAGTATITENRPNDVTIEVASGGGVLVLSDTYFPGWRASVDGDPTQIVRAYTTLRGVCVPPGEHTVTLRYRPQIVWLGAVLSAVGWALWGGAWAMTRAWRSQR